MVRLDLVAIIIGLIWKHNSKVEIERLIKLQMDD